MLRRKRTSNAHIIEAMAGEQGAAPVDLDALSGMLAKVSPRTSSPVESTAELKSDSAALLMLASAFQH